jgi:hypothetical protein
MAMALCLNGDNLLQGWPNDRFVQSQRPFCGQFRRQRERTQPIIDGLIAATQWNTIWQ